MNFYGYEQLFFLVKFMTPQYQLKYVYVFFLTGLLFGGEKS